MKRIQSLSTAIFIFLAAAARAGVVPPDFRAGANRLRFGLGFRRRRRFAHDIAGLFAGRAAGTGRGCAAERAGILVQRLLRRVAQKIFKCEHGRRAAENIVADFRFYVDHQFVKNLERLGLVFDERIALPMRAQADAVTQRIHFVKMLLPQFVNRAQDRETLDGHQFFRLLEIGRAHV